ncbi:MAG: hypothetical protein RIQ81_455 [Pseudomonadota bacterium]
MKQNHQIYAIDLGTSKFCIARVNPAAFGANGLNPSAQVIDSLAVPARGTRRGMIVEFNSALECLAGLVEQAESRWDCDIEHAVVGIAGSHLRSHVAKGSIALRADQPITGEALRKLNEQMVSSFSTSNAASQRDLLDAVATGWQVDQRDPVDDPTGFSGSTLSADFLMIDADKGYLRDVVRLVNGAGIRVTRLVSEPLASAHVCAGTEFRSLGCCVVDIGGGTSDGLVFVNGKPALAFSVPMAGFSMTADLSVALNIPHREAERIKTIYGLSASAAESITVESIHGAQKQVSGELVARIIEARCKELTIAVAKQLVPFKGKLGGGILLTGGGSQLQGLPELMSASMKVPVKAINPKFVDPAPGSLVTTRLAPKFATALGLLVLSMDENLAQSKGESADGNFTGAALPAPSLITRLRDWLKDMS